VPLEAILEVAGAVADGAVGPDVDAADLAGLVVDAHQKAGVGAAVDDVRVLRVRRDVAALAAGGRLPVALADAAAIAAVGNSHRRVILLGPVNPVRKVIVGNDAVELRRRLIVIRAPALAAVEGDLGAAIVADDHALRGGRVDPQVVMVAVWSADHAEVL